MGKTYSPWKGGVAAPSNVRRGADGVVGETQRMEFRADAYNLTNSFRPGNLNAALNNNTFGQIRTSQDPRIMQFALKYVF